jgi:hypothetical protein
MTPILKQAAPSGGSHCLNGTGTQNQSYGNGGTSNLSFGVSLRCIVLSYLMLTVLYLTSGYLFPVVWLSLYALCSFASAPNTWTVRFFYLNSSVFFFILAVALYRWFSRRARRGFDEYIMAQPCINADKNVSAFRQRNVDRPFDLDSHKPNVSNVHPDAARRRSAARHWIDSTIVSSGRINYALNCSSSDLLKGADGSRKLRTPKDFVYYRQTRHDTPSRAHHFSAVDDLDWYSDEQMSELLCTSLDFDSTIYSYMHMPTSASFKTDEFSVDYNVQRDLWEFGCADEDKYDQQLWDNTGSITSHYRFGEMTYLRCFMATILSIAIGLWVYYAHRTMDLTITTPFGFYCYDWFTFQYPVLVPFIPLPAEPFSMAFAGRETWVLLLPTIWDYLPAYWLGWQDYQYPWHVPCTDNTVLLIFAIMATITAGHFLVFIIQVAGLRSGFHFNFHIHCGNSRTIWVQHPAVRFGFFRTLWHICDVARLLPKRLRPTMIKTPASDLQPLGASIGAFTHISQKTSTRNYTYTLAGSAISTVFDERAYNVVKAHNLTAKLKMSVASFVLAYGHESKQWTTDQILVGINAVTYAEGHTSVISYVRPPTVTNYRFRVDDYVEQEHEPVLKPFFDGCTRGCTYIPQSSRGNTEHGVKTRITDVAPRDLPPNLNRYQERNLTSFIQQYKADINHRKVTMLSVDEVYERQGKPSQRRSNEEAMGYSPSDWLTYIITFGKRARSFQKTEAGMKPGDPRNITPVAPAVRLQNSRIALALASNMKKTGWYAFGLAPSEVARRVTAHVSDPRTAHIALGDYSRMDGTVNQLIRQFDLAFLYSNFEDCDHEEIRTWYELTYGNSVYAGNGISYDQGESQASGDPYTSALNTARNAFISYCCLLASPLPKQIKRVQALSEAAAYKNLGLMAGDDSIQRNITPKESVRTAATWGFSLKFVIAKPGDRVDFLARHYSPVVWNGAPDNMCSALRTLSKFHVSSMPTSVPPEVIAYTKAMSILSNDAATYLIGDWMRMIVAQTRPAFDKHNAKASAGLKDLLHNETQWNHRWATISGDLSETSYQAENTLDQDWQVALLLTEFGPEELDDFAVFLTNPESLWHACPILLERDAIPASTPYMGNGEIVDPSPAPDIRPTAENVQEGKHDIDTGKPSASEQRKARPPFKPPISRPRYPDDNFSKLAFICKRGDNTTGWYAGLGPCTDSVAQEGKYCAKCRKVFLKNRSAATPERTYSG